MTHCWHFLHVANLLLRIQLITTIIGRLTACKIEFASTFQFCRHVCVRISKKGPVGHQRVLYFHKVEQTAVNKSIIECNCQVHNFHNLHIIVYFEVPKITLQLFLLLLVYFVYTTTSFPIRSLYTAYMKLTNQLFLRFIWTKVAYAQHLPVELRLDPAAVQLANRHISKAQLGLQEKTDQ